MAKLALARRNFSILAGSNKNQLQALLDSLISVSGITNITLDSIQKTILVEYDAVKICYSGIEKILTDRQIDLPTGIKRRWLSIWYDYLDTTLRDNALAPPASCCNKPPVRPK